MGVGIMASAVVPATAPPAAFKTALGNALSQASSSTLTITTTAAIAVDDLVVVRWAADNLTATTPTATCTDSGGNSYTSHAAMFKHNTTAGDGVVGGVFATKATTAVATGGTITLTLSGAVTAKVMYAESFTGVDNALRTSPALTATGSSSGASAGTMPSGTYNAGDLIVGMLGAETRTTPGQDGDTIGGAPWTGATLVLSATGGTDNTRVEVAGVYKLPTAPANLTYDNTLGAITDWVTTAMPFRAASSGGGGGTVYTDNFDRANTTPPGLGSGWTDPSVGWFISSNKATLSSGNYYNRFLTDLGGPDHWVEADVTGISGAGNNYVVIGARTVSGSDANYYMCFVNPTNGVPTIGKNVGGTYSDVATGASVGTTDCKLRLEVQGTAIRMYRNGTLVASAADSSVTTGNFVGLNAFNSGTNPPTYDNFRCGTFPYTP